MLIGKWLLASAFDSDNDSDDFGHLDSESDEGEDEGLSAYTCQQQFRLGRLAALSRVVSTEPLASSSSSSSSSSRLCVVHFWILLVPWRNRKTLLVKE